MNNWRRGGKLKRELREPDRDNNDRKGWKHEMNERSDFEQIKHHKVLHVSRGEIQLAIPIYQILNAAVKHPKKRNTSGVISNLLQRDTNQGLNGTSLSVIIALAFTQPFTLSFALSLYLSIRFFHVPPSLFTSLWLFFVFQIAARSSRWIECSLTMLLQLRNVLSGFLLSSLFPTSSFHCDFTN